MDYESAFRKPFTDVKNLIIGIFLSLIPVVNLFALGYQIECSGLGRNKPSKKLPEWKNFGDYFVKGMLTALIAFVYVIPGLIVLIVGFATTFFSLLVANAPQMLNPLQGGNAMMQMMQNSIPSLIAVLPLFILASCLFLVSAYVIPSAALTFLKEKKFTAAFSFGKVFRKAFNGKYLAAFIVMLFTAIVFGLLLGWIPIVGGAATSFITGVIFYSLLGQSYK